MQWTPWATMLLILELVGLGVHVGDIGSVLGIRECSVLHAKGANQKKKLRRKISTFYLKLKGNKKFAQSLILDLS